MVRQRTKSIEGTSCTTERYVDSMSGTEKILGKLRDLTTITDGNRAIVSMGIVICRLLVVLKLKRVMS